MHVSDPCKLTKPNDTNSTVIVNIEHFYVSSTDALIFFFTKNVALRTNNKDSEILCSHLNRRTEKTRVFSPEQTHGEDSCVLIRTDALRRLVCSHPNRRTEKTRHLCDKRTPFGRPVVPLEKRISAVSLPCLTSCTDGSDTPATG